MDVAELRRWVDTRELMRRDRGNHRLKLDKLSELPTAVMKQVNYFNSRREGVAFRGGPRCLRPLEETYFPFCVSSRKQTQRSVVLASTLETDLRPSLAEG